MKNQNYAWLAAPLLAFAAVAPGMQAAEGDAWGMVKGDWEFTLGGGGTSDKDFANTAASANFSIGYFLTDRIEVALRQGLSYASAEDDGDAFAGQTRAAFDYHFKVSQKFYPYVGVNFGGIYGDAVVDSFAAGLEAGLKYYVLPKTFLFGHFEWAWSFEDTDEFDDAFEDGAFIYALGVGFNF